MAQIECIQTITQYFDRMISVKSERKIDNVYSTLNDVPYIVLIENKKIYLVWDQDVGGSNPSCPIEGLSKKKWTALLF